VLKPLDAGSNGRPGEPLLSVDGIETYYGSIQALKGISFKVDEGSIVTLLGANGAGKSTTLKSISGLVPPARGTVTFRGRRIDTLPSEKIVRLGISHVPEGRELFPELTVLENLKMGAYTRTDKRAIERALERAQTHFPILAERRSQLAGTLSGGEQQMLAIGRALMAEPRLMLLDEPSLGLAPLLVEEIFRIIRDIHRAGTTVLLVEQNANKALSIAGYGYVLETGTISLQGDSRRLLRDDHVRRSYLGHR
jgi:branched-chain amino acid transport system ATP-binding protein